jgi:hypothetical protein
MNVEFINVNLLQLYILLFNLINQIDLTIAYFNIQTVTIADQGDLDVLKFINIKTLLYLFIFIETNKGGFL